MAVDRVGELLEGNKRRRLALVSPEGVPLELQLAGHGERLTAFMIDMALMLAAVIVLYLSLIFMFFSGVNLSVGLTLILFLSFLVRTLYFAHFELAWQGRTPGKKVCGLRVVSRAGGELTPSAVIARNLTREVEIFLPLSLFFDMGEATGWQDLTLLGWALTLTAIPLFNREHLRAGDIIGGTRVIAMPKRLLLGDLSIRENSPVSAAEAKKFEFTHEQLAIYGNFELQVLEEFLRRPAAAETERLLMQVATKIRRKIGWEEELAASDVRNFLNAFYSAERADLERGRLFGRHKADKNSPR